MVKGFQIKKVKFPKELYQAKIHLSNLSTSTDLTDAGRKTLDFILTPSFSDFDLQPHRLV